MAGIHADCETQDAKVKSVVTSAVPLNVWTHSTPKINLVYRPKKTAQSPLSKAEHARDTA